MNTIQHADYSHYALRSVEEYNNLAREEGFIEFWRKAESFLWNMPEDSTFRFAEKATDEKHIRWFIKIADAHILWCNPEWMINSQYTTITRRSTNQFYYQIKKRYYESIMGYCPIPPPPEDKPYMTIKLSSGETMQVEIK